jgi:glycosyltransferase involved in cell wall biosynthesis
LAHGYLGIRRLIVKYVVGRYASSIVPISINDALPWQENAKTKVVYNAVDHTIFDASLDAHAFRLRHAIPLDAPVILFVGGISREKGTHVILHSFIELLKKLPTAHLVIAGPWDLADASWEKYMFPVAHYKRTVAALMRQIPSSNITILGTVSPIAPVMAATNIIVFPATVGHFARPVIEAGYMKKVVIASDCPPLTELVINNVTGFLVSPTDYNAWTEKMYILLANRQLSDMMANAAYNFCLKQFSIKNQIEVVQELYESFFV